MWRACAGQGTTAIPACRQAHHQKLRVGRVHSARRLGAPAAGRARKLGLLQCGRERATPGFKLGAIAALNGESIVAAAPLFRVAYRIDTPLQGRLRQIGDWVHARWPRVVSFPVIGIGSPMSDNCALGFAPELSDADCAHAFDGPLRHLAHLAKADRGALLAVKSLDRSAEVLDETFRRHRYKCVTSVPLAMLDLPIAASITTWTRCPRRQAPTSGARCAAPPR
jgi:hypothetical protein